MINASQGAGVDTGGGDLIPKGQLAYCTIAKAEPKVSKSGRRYVSLDLVINPDQPFERRHIWHNMMDFTDSGHSEAAATMGLSQLSRILEVGKSAHPSKPESYQIKNWHDLVGMLVAVKIGIEKGRDGYDDKNNVEFLTPNPDSSTHKTLKLLAAGQHSPKASPAAQASGFDRATQTADAASGFDQPGRSAQQSETPDSGAPSAGGPAGASPSGW